jgi:hypothetical protein
MFVDDIRASSESARVMISVGVGVTAYSLLSDGLGDPTSRKLGAMDRDCQSSGMFIARKNRYSRVRCFRDVGVDGYWGCALNEDLL